MRLSSRKPHEVTRSQQDRQEIRGKPHQRSVFSSFFSESHVQFINSISGGRKPRISPLRCASVEMTKGRAVLPSTVVAEQEPFFITLGGPKAHDSSVEKHFQGGTAEPQIPPLRYASVGMTKGRAELPGRVVAEQEPFFIFLGGPKGPMTTPAEKHFQDSAPARTVDPSTSLRFGRDDKGEGGASIESSC